MKVRPLSDDRHEDLWKFVNDFTARDAFEARILSKVWSKMNELFPHVTEVSMKILLMFPSIYLCEQGFSSMFCM